ncbi:MAG TPA: HlyD family efflux transporter periplasmic adaptor subunit [Gemmatimonadales bacterium]|nr:HlyD family efflux transporter periplasmic adaptor subunit [Gemmatimonadales bacterium]
MNRVRPLALALVAIVILALVLVIAFRSDTSGATIVASGTVEATEADLGFQIPGRIDSVLVDEGVTVEAGTRLATLDRAELEARRRSAVAQVASARARLAELESGFRSEEVAQGRAAERAAAQRLANARAELERARRLFDGGAVSRSVMDQAQTAYDVAEAEHERVRQQLELLERGARVEQVAAQRALLAQAEAAVAQLDAALDGAVIEAPFRGIVTVRHREPGETVPAGAPVVTLMNPTDRWVRIYVRGDEVGRLALGQPATISADAYPNRAYAGEVTFIASEAEFTPRNVQTTEDRVKLVYRVKVRITDDHALDLKPGLPADVRITVEGAAAR